MLLRAVVLLIAIGSGAPLSAQESAAFAAGLSAKDRGHYATAIRSWLPLAEAGSAEAANNIGHMYEEGLGVAQNYQTAMDWYRKAAQQELPQAQHNVGLLYYNGYGVAANPREGVRWFRLAANQQLAESEYMLGVAYQSGEGVELDYAEARRWFLLSARQGYGNAQMMYAYLLLAGDGAPDTEPAPGRAYVWAQVAARQGQTSADDIRALAVISMEDEDVAEADALVDLCLTQGLASCPE
jgi:TPR repeat protein